MVNKSVASGIGEKEGRVKINCDSILCSELQNKTKIQFTGKKNVLHTSFQFNRGIFIKGWDWMFCHVIYTVNHLTICRGRLRGACNQLVTHPTTVVIAPYPVIVMSPHGFNLSFLPIKIFLITGAQPKAGTGHKMQRVSVFSKLQEEVYHCFDL